VISKLAQADLTGAARWWAENRSHNEAEGWYSGFLEKLYSLAESPGSHPPAAEDKDFPYVIRQINYKVSARPTHRAVFTATDQETVVILRIRHAAQDAISEHDVQLDGPSISQSQRT